MTIILGFLACKTSRINREPQCIVPALLLDGRFLKSPVLGAASSPYFQDKHIAMQLDALIRSQPGLHRGWWLYNGGYEMLKITMSAIAIGNVGDAFPEHTLQCKRKRVVPRVCVKLSHCGRKYIYGHTNS